MGALKGARFIVPPQWKAKRQQDSNMKTSAILKVLGSVSCGGLEPPDHSAPRGDLGTAHRSLQPLENASASHFPASRTHFRWFRKDRGSWFRRREPVGARASQSPLGNDAGRRALRG